MEVKAAFECDTKKYHKFLIDETEIKGSLYFLKDGEKIPDEVLVKLKGQYEK